MQTKQILAKSAASFASFTIQTSFRTERRTDSYKERKAAIWVPSARDTRADFALEALTLRCA